MAINFKHVGENKKPTNNNQNNNNSKIVSENRQKNKDNKTTTKSYTTAVSRHHFFYKSLFRVFGWILGILSGFVMAGAVLCWLVFFWYAPKHLTEQTLSMLIIVKNVFVGFSLAFGALLLTNCIFLIIDGTVLAQAHVYNWGAALACLAAGILAFFVKPIALIRDIDNCLTVLSFVSLALILAFGIMISWIGYTPTYRSQEIESPIKITSWVLFGSLAVAALYASIVIFSMGGSPSEEYAGQVYFRMWALVEFLLLGMAVGIWLIVFTMIEDVFSFGLTFSTLGAYIPIIIVAILVLVSDQTSLVNRRIIIGIISLPGAGLMFLPPSLILKALI